MFVLYFSVTDTVFHSAQSSDATRGSNHSRTSGADGKDKSSTGDDENSVQPVSFDVVADKMWKKIQREYLPDPVGRYVSQLFQALYRHQIEQDA